MTIIDDIFIVVVIVCVVAFLVGNRKGIWRACVTGPQSSLFYDPGAGKADTCPFCKRAITWQPHEPWKPYENGRPHGCEGTRP